MSNTSPGEALKAALAAAGAASQSLMPDFERNRRGAGPALKTWQKDKGALVTEADIAADKAITASLGDSSVAAGVISEESVSGDHSGDESWLVDPLCGTVPFRSGMPHWGVNIALRSGSELVAGVIAVPPLGHVLAGSSGGKVTLNGDRFAGGDPELPVKEAIVGLEIDGLEEWRRLLGLESSEKRPEIGWAGSVGHTNTFCSAAYPLYLVCMGGMSGVVFYRIDTVHLAAGALIAQQLGAVVSDEHGQLLDWRAEQTFEVVIVAWPSVHGALLDAMKG